MRIVEMEIFFAVIAVAVAYYLPTLLKALWAEAKRRSQLYRT